MPKASKDEIERRVEFCFDLLSKAASSHYIRQKTQEKYGVSETVAYRYLKAARERVREKVMLRMPTALQESVQILDRIVHMAVFEGQIRVKDGIEEVHYDLNAGRNALADKMKLLGFTQDNIEIHLNMIGKKHQDILEIKPQYLKEEMKLLEATVVE